MRILVIGCFIALTSPAFAQTTDAPISTRTDAEEGTYLVDANGVSLYIFKADSRNPPKSACEDTACVGTWPPLIVGEMPKGDETVDPSLLGTMTRADGSLQATYNGWPLYYYFEDFAPGDINGHDIESFGEDWYLVGPHGERAERDRRRDDNDGEDGDDDD